MTWQWHGKPDHPRGYKFANLRRDSISGHMHKILDFAAARGSDDAAVHALLLSICELTVNIQIVINFDKLIDLHILYVENTFPRGAQGNAFITRAARIIMHTHTHTQSELNCKRKCSMHASKLVDLPAANVENMFPRSIWENAFTTLTGGHLQTHTSVELHT